jgi:predicted metalloprotease
MGHRWFVITGLLSALAAPAATPPRSPEAATIEAGRALFQAIESFWTEQIAGLGGRYRPATLRFFHRPLKPTCGIAAPLAGPFYCPDTETVYLDVEFLQRLQQRAPAGATAALGYVIAHELAHHVQGILGTTLLVEQARSRSTQTVAARTLITFELQADCYAGLWLRSAAQSGSTGAPAGIAAVLDEVAISSRWQQAQLHAPEQMLDPLTHGTAPARLKWLHVGLDHGDFNACDTFGAEAAGRP